MNQTEIHTRNDRQESQLDRNQLNNLDKMIDNEMINSVVVNFKSKLALFL
jgi:hypothetical protein